jgi:hypothetical protein
MATPALHWRSLVLGNAYLASDADIWNLIKQHMEELGLSNVKKNPSDVVGLSQDTVVATTFAKLGEMRYMLFIMAAGNHALVLCNQLYDKLKQPVL